MKKMFRGAPFYIIMIILIVVILKFMNTPTTTVTDLSFSEFYQKLETKQITEINIIDFSVTGIYKEGDKEQEFSTYIPYAIRGEQLSELVMEQSKNGDLKVVASKAPQKS